MDYRDVPHSRSLSTRAPFGLHREFTRAVPRTPTMREFCKASLFLSRVAAFGQSQGRFYFIFAVPISSVIYEVRNDFLFKRIRLFPYLVAVTGAAFFLSALVKDLIPQSLAIGDGRGYFWQFGPVAGEHGDSRTIRIGEYSEWRQFRLLAHSSENQSLAIQVNGNDPTIDRNAREGVLINKSPGKHYLGTVRAESRETPTLTIAKADSH
jgi:hypothetical protein